MIGDNHLDLGRQRHYHRQAVDELAELRNELVNVRRELDQTRADRDAWITAYRQRCSAPDEPTEDFS